MSPCSKCALAMADKNNSACLRCEARYLYATTGARDIEPPQVDPETVAWSFAKNGAGSPNYSRRSYTRRKARVGKPDAPCQFPGCKRNATHGPYCEPCYKRVRRRIQIGTPPLISTEEARRLGQKKRLETLRLVFPAT